MMRPILILTLWMASLISGCALFIGDENKSECATDDECPMGEVCRLIPGDDFKRCLAYIEPDMGDVEVDMADVEVDMGDAEVDMGDAEVDMGDAEVDMADAEVDMGLPPVFGPTGECFSDEGDIYSSVTSSSGEAPQVLCGPYGRGWTARVDGGYRLFLERDAMGQVPEEYVIAPGQPVIMEGPVLLMSRPNALEGGATNIWRKDLNREAPEYPIKPGSLAQRDAVRGGDFIAFLEARLGGTEQVLVVEDETESIRGCGQSGRTQWGVSAGDDWIAWFELRQGSRRPRLVIAPALACADLNRRRERILRGDIAGTARIHRSSRGLLWLEADILSGQNVIWRWDFQTPGAEPQAVEYGLGNQMNPVEITSRGRWLAVVSFSSSIPRYVLDLVDLDGGGSQLDPSRRDRRVPVLSDLYLIWAEQTDRSNWEVRYERIPD